MIVGLLGLAGSGKGTVADYMVTEFGYEKQSFASPIKDITSTLFVDIGSVWGLDNRFGLIDDKHNLRSSVGVNFIWDSAIGPINFIFAETLKKQETDATDTFYFDIGYNF